MTESGRWLLLLGLSTVGAAGCSSPIVGTDVGSSVDAPPALDAPASVDAPAATDAGPDVTHAGGGAAVYDCLGMPVHPPEGSTLSVGLRVSDLASGGIGAAHTVHVFGDEAMAPSTCDAGAMCVSVSTSGGVGTISVPAGAFRTVRVFPGPIALDTILNHSRAPLIGSERWEVGYFSGEARDVGIGSLAHDVASGTAALVGTIRDCADLGVGESVVRIFRADGRELVVGPGRLEPVIGYFASGSLTPTAGRTRTSDEGRWVAFNVPIEPGERLRVEAWGNVGGTLTRLACETAAAMPDGAGIVELGPVRSDYPATSLCAP